MSSPEFTELRGISAVCTAARAALLEDPKQRELLWWIQAQSLHSGGLRKIVAGLLEQFPDRLGSRSMLKDLRNTEVFTGKELYRVQCELGLNQNRLEGLAAAALRNLAAQEDGSCCVQEAERDFSRADLVDFCREQATEKLGAFLIDLCINPCISLTHPSDDESGFDSYIEGTRDQFPTLKTWDFDLAQVPYFHGLLSALQAFKENQEAAQKATFTLTEIGRQVWESLDFSLERKGMVLIEGLEGRGKSAALKAWCDSNSGRARWVSLKGTSGKANVFRAIAKALGIAGGYTFKAIQLQNRIEDVLQRSGLMLCLDEAHWLFDQRPKMYSRPELVDWINTALCNENIPVALCATPQFLDSVKQAADQVNWNFRQWRRRVKKFVQLPDWNTPADLTQVARKILPGIPETGITLAVGYARLRELDISGLADVAEEAKLLAKAAGRETICYEDIDRAITENLQPSDTAFAKRLNQMKPARRRRDRGNLEESFFEEETIEPNRPAAATPSDSAPGRINLHPELLKP